MTFAADLVTNSHSPAEPTPLPERNFAQTTDWIAVHRALVIELDGGNDDVDEADATRHGESRRQVADMLQSPESSPLLLEMSKVLAAFPCSGADPSSDGAAGNGHAGRPAAFGRFAHLLSRLLDYDARHVPPLISRFLSCCTRSEEEVAKHAALQRKKVLIARLKGRPLTQQKVLSESILGCTSSDELSAVDKVLDRLRLNITDAEAKETARAAVEKAKERSSMLRIGVYLSEDLLARVRRFHYEEIAAMGACLMMLVQAARKDEEGAAFRAVRWLIQKKKLHEVVAAQIKAIQAVNIHKRPEPPPEPLAVFAGMRGCEKPFELELVQGEALPSAAIADHLDAWAMQKVKEMEMLLALMLEINGVCQKLFAQGVQQDLFARLNGDLLSLYAGRDAKSVHGPVPTMSSLVNLVPMQLASCMQQRQSSQRASERLMQAWVSLLVQAMDLPSVISAADEHILSFCPSNGTAEEARFHDFFFRVSAAAHGGIALMQLAWTIYLSQSSIEFSQADLEEIFNTAYPHAFTYLASFVNDCPPQPSFIFSVEKEMTHFPLLLLPNGEASRSRSGFSRKPTSSGHFPSSMSQGLASAVRPLLAGLVSAFNIEKRLEAFSDLKLLSALIIASCGDASEMAEVLDVGDGQWAMGAVLPQLPMQALVRSIVAADGEPGPGLNLLAMICRSKTMGCLLMERVNVIALLERYCAFEVRLFL